LTSAMSRIKNICVCASLKMFHAFFDRALHQLMMSMDGGQDMCHSQFEPCEHDAPFRISGESRLGGEILPQRGAVRNWDRSGIGAFTSIVHRDTVLRNSVRIRETVLGNFVRIRFQGIIQIRACIHNTYMSKAFAHSTTRVRFDFTLKRQLTDSWAFEGFSTHSCSPLSATFNAVSSRDS
jgi:hypothetical protein